MARSAETKTWYGWDGLWFYLADLGTTWSPTKLEEYLDRTLKSDWDKDGRAKKTLTELLDGLKSRTAATAIGQKG